MAAPRALFVGGAFSACLYAAAAPLHVSNRNLAETADDAALIMGGQTI